MMTLASFLEHIDRASGNRSDTEVSRAAGLHKNALGRVREGSAPSLERAARLADAVGLELVLRPKGEVINLRALQLSVASVLLSGSWGDAARSAQLPIEAVLKSAEAYGKILTGVYQQLESGFRPPRCDNPEDHYRDMVRALGLYHQLRQVPPTGAEEEMGAILLSAGLAAPGGDRGPAQEPPDPVSAEAADRVAADAGPSDEDDSAL